MTDATKAVIDGLAAALRDPECPIQFSPLLMEARQILAREAWRPIETAPKDGTIVLVCGKNWRGEYYICDVKWNDGDWCLFDPEADSHSYPSYEHTHWMPLPKPPALSAAVRGSPEGG